MPEHYSNLCLQGLSPRASSADGEAMASIAAAVDSLLMFLSRLSGARLRASDGSLAVQQTPQVSPLPDTEANCPCRPGPVRRLRFNQLTISNAWDLTCA